MPRQAGKERKDNSNRLNLRLTFVFTLDVIVYFSMSSGSVRAVGASIRLLSRVTSQVILQLVFVVMLVFAHFTSVRDTTGLFTSSDVFIKTRLQSWSETTQEAALLYS